MTKKKETGLVPSGVPTEPVAGAPDFSKVLESVDLSLADKRREVLEGLRLKGTRKKYATPEEKKEAQLKRRLERRTERVKALAEYGLEPRKRGPKKTEAEKKTSRKTRGKARRDFMREMAIDNPELAKTYGIDPTKFKKK